MKWAIDSTNYHILPDSGIYISLMINVTKGSGNVFRDLGLADADLLQAKADLVYRISKLIEQRGLTQLQAADVL
ncbi:MAG: helix-turn-helix domain-containing protein, partial [Candidatus Binataceae bacterium]